MEITKYSKKKLYSILRNAIFVLANYFVLEYLLKFYTEKDELEYNNALVKIFSISKSEYADLFSFENYPRDCLSPKPSFFVLSREEMCNIIKTVLLKLNDKEFFLYLKEFLYDFKTKYPSSPYVSRNFILNLFEIRASEYNEIINYEETLFFQGVKDNGKEELTPEIEEMIQKFLIKGVSLSGKRR